MHKHFIKTDQLKIARIYAIVTGICFPAIMLSWARAGVDFNEPVFIIVLLLLALAVVLRCIFELRKLSQCVNVDIDADGKTWHLSNQKGSCRVDMRDIIQIHANRAIFAVHHYSAAYLSTNHYAFITVQLAQPCLFGSGFVCAVKAPYFEINAGRVGMSHIRTMIEVARVRTH